MFKSRRVVGPRVIIGCVTVLALLVMLVVGGNPVTMKSLAQEEAAEPAPPADQTYTGAKRCSSCHFQQYMSWKKTKHADAFDLLTAKYEKDEKCLKCHATGFGEASGYKAGGDSNLAGVTCETCHGPGSKHEEVSQPYAKTKELPPDAEKAIRDSIWRMIPRNVCVECHTVQGHGKSETPADMKK